MVDMPKRFSKTLIRHIWNHLYMKNINCLIGITGDVGTGKTITGSKIGYDVDPKFNPEESMVYTVDDLMEASLKCVKIKGKKIDVEDFKKIPNIREYLFKNEDKLVIKRGKVIIMDETGATGAYVRDFLSKDNKAISKLIQLWRVLGSVVIFIVPADMKLAESTILRFLNIEIRMTKVNRNKGTAECIAWSYFGWNKKTKEPMRRRIKGCRYGGKIIVKCLPKEIVKKIDTLSKIYKIDAIIKLRLQGKIDKSIQVGSTKTIWDDINYIKEHIEKFKNEKGKITVGKIRLNLNIPYHKAQIITQHFRELEAKTDRQP